MRNVELSKLQIPTNYSSLNREQKAHVRRLYIAKQKGMCCHCGNRLSQNPCSSIRSRKIDPSLFPKGFFEFPIHLHHDHKTDQTIGVVHSLCNAVLWQYYNK